MLEKFGIVEYKPQSISLLVGILFSVTDSSETQEKINEMKKILYCETLELLMWLQVVTQPNLLFTVNYLLCFAANPKKVHWCQM